VIGTVLPVLTCVNQWTQVLSMNGQVNIPLIPLSVAKIEEDIEIFMFRKLSLQLEPIVYWLWS
jgi:hypothetical protein